MMTAIPSHPLWETKMTGTRDKMLPTMPTTLMTVIPATQLRTRTMRMKMTMMIEKINFSPATPVLGNLSRILYS